MKDGQVIDLDDNLALVAAELSYELKLPLADSVILATARTHKALLWTQDAHFKGLDGIQYVEKTL
jgi:predicted nucleic acid-binding protein